MFLFIADRNMIPRITRNIEATRKSLTHMNKYSPSVLAMQKTL
jgi:hypothetical protein